MSPVRAQERLWSWWAAVLNRKPPRPQVAIELGALVPAWALRAACAVAATGCTLMVASDGFHWMVAIVLVGVTVARPSGAAPWLFVIGTGLLMLASEEDPFHARTFLLALALHCTVGLAAVVGDLAWSASVEVRVLAGFARRFLAIQALVQPAALIGAWVTTRELSLTWLPVVAGLALAGMAWALLLLTRADGNHPRE